MRVQLLLPAALVVSVALVVLMKIRKKEHDKEDKRNRFEDIKLRVTYDVLKEYQHEQSQTQKLLDKTLSRYNALEEEMNMIQMKAETLKGKMDICQESQKTAKDELTTVENEFNHLQAETEQEKNGWRTEVENLKIQLARPSSLCEFLKNDSPTARQLCGQELIVTAPEQQEPKAEAPKQEEAKAEAPKQQEPKVEAPKQQEPKVEAPKQQEPKVEAPKQEEAKAEAPKQQEPKVEAPKQQEPKAEAPKQEEPKVEEGPKAEAPKQEEQKADAPK